MYLKTVSKRPAEKKLTGKDAMVTWGADLFAICRERFLVLLGLRHCWVCPQRPIQFPSEIIIFILGSIQRCDGICLKWTVFFVVSRCSGILFGLRSVAWHPWTCHVWWFFGCVWCVCVCVCVVCVCVCVCVCTWTYMYMYDYMCMYIHIW